MRIHPLQSVLHKLELGPCDLDDVAFRDELFLVDALTVDKRPVVALQIADAVAHPDVLNDGVITRDAWNHQEANRCPPRGRCAPSSSLADRAAGSRCRRRSGRGSCVTKPNSDRNWIMTWSAMWRMSS